MSKTTKYKKPRRTPKAFFKRYFRLIVGGLIIGSIALCGIFAPFIATHDPYYVDMAIKNSPPDAEHIFGTDHYGRDLFSRIVYGARVTLGVALLVQVLAYRFAPL